MFKKNKVVFILIGFFIIFTLLFGCSTREIPNDNSSDNLVGTNLENLEMNFIDVGQGDCTLIKLPKGEALLIDAGGNGAAETVVDYLKSQGINKLDFVIGTHPHEDHIGGLDVVIKSFQIGKVYLPKVSHNSKSFEDLLLAIQEKGLKVTEAKSGVEIGTGEEVKAVFVAPNNSNYQNLNNYSAVLKLSYGKTGFLFTGDAEEKSEGEMLLQLHTPLEAEVLKVGHHGSVTSTSQEFLDEVSPSFAIIPVGRDNDYGHPHREIIERLEAKNIQYFRTDLQGTIIALSDGQEIKFNNDPFTNNTEESLFAGSVKIQAIDLQKEEVLFNKS
jgi:competence protein ComEC